MKKTIGILGGMGPLATADLLIKIVTMTRAGCDNEHIRVFVDDNSAIPDRTAAILHGGPDPVPEMLSALRNLEKCGADCLLMPCNTAHYYLPRLQRETAIPFLNVLTVTAARCRELFPGKTAAILATTGALATGLYQDALTAKDVPYLLPDADEQAKLMHLIYDLVKASLPLHPEIRLWQEVLDGLRQRGADYFILGCTELPIVANTLELDGPFLDPTAELARAAILYCGYEVKE